jgi:hypothetical protein
MTEGRRYGLHEGLVIVSEDPEKGVSQKRADFIIAVFTVFRNFGVENHPKVYSVPGLWPSRSVQSVFQRYKRLKVDCLIFEGGFHSLWNPPD